MNDVHSCNEGVIRALEDQVAAMKADNARYRKALQEISNVLDFQSSVGVIEMRDVAKCALSPSTEPK